MAEILVEPNNNNRRRSPIWPWILGLALILGLIWFVVERGEDNPEPVATTTTAPIPQDRELDENLDNNVYERTSAAGEASSPIAAFINFAEQENNQQQDQPHAYASQGIEKLSAALLALAEREGTTDGRIDQRKETFQQNARRLQRNPQSLQQASTVKATFIEASELLAAIQEKSYPDSDADIKEVREAANDLDDGKALQDQQDQVEEFFDEIGEALETMNKEQGGTEPAVQNENL